jgi:hypothetical protein
VKLIRPSSYFLLVILAAMLALEIRSLGFKHIETKLLPMIVGGLVFILAAIELIRELKAANRARGVARPETTPVKAEASWSRHLLAWAWIVGFFVAVYLFGFIIVTPLFVFFYVQSQGGTRLASASLAGLTTVFIYGVFEWFLKVNLSKGLLLGW